jgi:hypothetical protein
VGVEHRSGGARVAHVHPHDLVPAAGAEAHHLCAVLVIGGAGGVPPPAARGGPGDLGDGEAAGGGVGDDDGVGRRRGREEGEARGDGGRHAAHACRLPPAVRRVKVGSSCSCAAASWRTAACDAMRAGFGSDGSVDWCETEEREEVEAVGAHFCRSSFFFSLLFFNSALLLVWRLAAGSIYRWERSGLASPDRNVADRLRLVPAIGDAAAVLLPCWTGMCDAIWHAN